MSKFFSPAHSSLKEYTPGEQPQDKKYIKLNTNESPYPPSDKVIEAITSEEVSKLMLYPDPCCNEFCQCMAKEMGVSHKNIIAGNGSDEILSFLFLAYCMGNKGAAFADITYGFYKVFAALYGVDTRIIPLTENYEIDYRDYLNLNETIFIANPNAPTGIFMPLWQIEEILKANSDNIVVIDEAYIDFGGESAVSLLPFYKNLVICRTFSKSRSLAGARLGYAVADEEIIKDLNKIRYSLNPYNINRLTLLCGKAATQSREYYNEMCEKIIKTREWLTKELEKSGFDILPSKANFIFAMHPQKDGEYLYKELKERGILVRYFSGERVSKRLRITIGTMEECEALVNTIKEII